MYRYIFPKIFTGFFAFSAIDKFKYKLPYKDIFGGVSAMSRQDFVKVNGFSNRFWGWGGEDDDIRRRINKAGLKLTRYSPLVARYPKILHSGLKETRLSVPSAS